MWKLKKNAETERDVLVKPGNVHEISMKFEDVRNCLLKISSDHHLMSRQSEKILPNRNGLETSTVLSPLKNY